MNHPEDFEDRNEERTETLGEVTEASATPEEAPEASAQSAAASEGTAGEDVGTDSAPRASFDGTWYGVSYENRGEGYAPSMGYGYPPYGYETTPPKPKKKGRRIALVALCVAVCMLFSFAAGVGGSLLFGRYLEGPDLPVNGTPLAGIGTDEGGEVYGTDGDEDYEYGDASLEKKDGTELTGHANGSAGDNKGTTITATAIAKDSVVEIMTTTESHYGRITAGAGSGVIIHGDGVIVTNHHVIDGATTVRVRLTNGNTYEAVVRGSDEDGDIAVIKIQPRETLTVAKMGSSAALALGEEVIAIGNPLGSLGGTVTNGIVSATERQINVDGITMKLIQTNAAINSGNSGGGLFNLAGELVGVVNAKFAAEGVEGLGFAIPIDTAIVSINHLLQLGYIPGIPALGADITVQSATMNAQRICMPYVSSATSDSTLKQGDYIYSVNGEVVVVSYINYYNGAADPLNLLKQLIRQHEVGDTVTLVVYRGGTATTVSVKLVEYIPSNGGVNFS